MFLPQILNGSALRVEDDHLRVGLVAWYPFHDGVVGGDRATINNGKVNDVTQTFVEAHSEPASVARFLNGGANYGINCGNSSYFQITRDLTVSCWVYRNSTSANGVSQELIAKDKDTGGRAFTLDILGLGSEPSTARFYINGGGGSLEIDVVGGSLLQKWEHFVATVSQADGFIRLYKNGSQVGSSHAAALINTATANVTLGYREYAGFNNPFDGWMGDTRIYNRALTPAEVLALYNRWFIRPSARLPDLPALFSSGIHANAALTQANATLSATAALPISANVALTQANATLSAAAALPINASVTVTQANAALSATAALPVNATVALTQDNFLLSATATTAGGVNANAALVQSDFVLAANAITGGVAFPIGVGGTLPAWGFRRKKREPEEEPSKEEIREELEVLEQAAEIAPTVAPTEFYIDRTARVEALIADIEAVRQQADQIEQVAYTQMAARAVELRRQFEFEEQKRKQQEQEDEQAAWLLLHFLQ